MIGKVTLKELSAKAGVSIATVSRAINNPDSVKKGTLEKIQIAMDGINKKSNIIAFVIPDITNMFFPLLLKGVEAIISSNLVVLKITKMIIRSYHYPKERWGIFYCAALRCLLSHFWRESYLYIIYFSFGYYLGELLLFFLICN